MPGNYTIITRQPGELITADKYNGDHQVHLDNSTPQGVDDYSATVVQMQQQTDPGSLGSENLALSLAGELERLRFVLARLANVNVWYEISGGFLVPVETETLVNASPGLSQIVATAAFPANSEALWAGGRVVTNFGTSNGLTTVQIGDPAEGEDWWSTGMGIVANDVSSMGQSASRRPILTNAAARDVIVTAIGGPFDAVGQIRITTWSLTLVPR